MSAAAPTWEPYQSEEDGQWRWRVRGRNGEIVIPPEGHASEIDAIRAFQTAKRLMAAAVKKGKP